MPVYEGISVYTGVCKEEKEKEKVNTDLSVFFPANML
jgi:hypothetical protein